jgi:hypothetical protein
MGVRPDEDFAVQAPGWNHEQLTVHLHHGERRSARAAEAFDVSSSRQIELPDFIFS